MTKEEQGIDFEEYEKIVLAANEHEVSPAKEEQLPVKQKPKEDIQQEEEVVQEKEELHQISKEADKPEDITKLEKELEKIKKSLHDTKQWGHKKNLALVQAKKKLTNYLEKLESEGAIYSDDKADVLKFFDEADNADISATPTSSPTHSNPFDNMKNRLDQEFNQYKKYNKSDPHLDEYYDSFFNLFLISEDKEKIMDYLSTEDLDVALDMVITQGQDFYNKFYKRSKSSGGFLNFVTYLLECEEENKKLRKDLDSTTKKVYTKSLNSKVMLPNNSNSQNSIQELYESLFK